MYQGQRHAPGSERGPTTALPREAGEELAGNHGLGRKGQSPFFGKRPIKKHGRLRVGKDEQGVLHTQGFGKEIELEPSEYDENCRRPSEGCQI